ncbi:penicillopepsin [Rhypophila sp. PSN 637]
MRFLLLSLLFIDLVGQWVTGAPTRIQKRTFKVERVRNQYFKGRNGPKELFKAYRKYHMPLPPALLEALRNQTNRDPSAGTATTAAAGAAPARLSLFPVPDAQPAPATSQATGGVAAIPEGNDIEYLAPVDIGGQTLNLDFDTGSSDLWVFSTELSRNEAGRHQVFNPQQSVSFQTLRGHTFSIQYGDGSGASGVVGLDVVNIGGVMVDQQAVELATKVSQSFVDDVENNGLLGLAFSQLNTVTPTKQKTFFENVLPSLAEPLFTADLRHDAPGAYEFGRVDATKFIGDLAWIPVNKTRGFWQFSTSSFGVDTGSGLALQTTPMGQAIADTGTTLMVVSQEISDGYYSKVPGARDDDGIGGMTFPCDAPLPDLFVDVGGVYTARVKGEDINFSRVQGNTCFGGVQPTTGDLQIWGDVFFKSQFVAFNGGNDTLGMAQHA